MNGAPGPIIFDPATYKHVEQSLSLEDNKLSNDELLRYAKIASDLRIAFS